MGCRDVHINWTAVVPPTADDLLQRESRQTRATSCRIQLIQGVTVVLEHAPGKIMECRGDRPRLKPVIVRLARHGWIDRLDAANRLREHLHACGPFDEDCEHGRLFNGRGRDQLTVMGKQNGALVTERLVNNPAFLVADRRSRPFGEIGAVVVALSDWFNGLAPQDRRNLERVAKMTASIAMSSDSSSVCMLIVRLFAFMSRTGMPYRTQMRPPRYRAKNFSTCTRSS
jgi:hypothetical protein